GDRPQEGRAGGDARVTPDRTDPDMTLCAENLCVKLGPNPALQDVSLSFAPGRFTVVIGPNGAGKTTLLRCLAGLAVPDSGTVRLQGKPLESFTARERA